LNDSALRTLAGISSGQISLNSFYGKSSVLPLAVPTNFSVTQANTEQVQNTLTWTNSNPTDTTRIIKSGPGGLTSYYVSPGVSSYTDNQITTDTYYEYAVAHYRNGTTGPQTSYLPITSRPETPKFPFIQSTPGYTDRLLLYWGLQIWPTDANNNTLTNYTVTIFKNGVSIATYSYSSYTYSLLNIGLTADTVYTYGIRLNNTTTGLSSYTKTYQAKTRPSTNIVTNVGWNYAGQTPYINPGVCEVSANAYIPQLTNMPANWQIRCTTYYSQPYNRLTYEMPIASTTLPNVTTTNTPTTTYAGFCTEEGGQVNYEGMYEIAVFNEYGTKMTYGITQGGSNGSPYFFYSGFGF
jgi:hypothetical protein